DKDQVLLRSPADSGEWHRSDPGTAVNIGDKLLALPTFQPTVTLAAGVTLQLVPETLIELAGIDQGVPVVRVHYGRVILMTTGNAGVKVKLALGDFTGTLVFDDAEAKVGAEVRPYHLPGVDPEKNQPQRSVSLYAINGDASWLAAGGNPEKLHAPGRLALSPDIQPNPEREVPKWAVAETPSPLDARAAKELNKALDEKRPVTQALLELSSHRRAENKSMAARALALIGEFGPFDNLFNDPDEKAVWPIQIESLKAALARGPAVAAKIRAALEGERGKEGDELYRMLWGYSKDDLAAGAAAKLIDYLDHDSMDMRVLAFYNLRQIVGPGGPESYYRPEQPAPVRQQSIRRWRERFKDGQLGAKPAGAKGTAGETTDKAAPEALPKRSTEGATPIVVPPAPDAGPK
ncbi:MAG TPA: hypothetical protein VKB78_03640, partial [Pirellulales bacterium]|nr:hypothetical protein [Pirellulales bacterium]